MIFVRSPRSGQRALKSIVLFIENTLYLKVNMDKTNVGYISKTKFLGYSFYINKNQACFRVHARSITKIRDRVKEITSRSNGIGN